MTTSHLDETGPALAPPTSDPWAAAPLTPAGPPTATVTEAAPVSAGPVAVGTPAGAAAGTPSDSSDDVAGAARPRWVRPAFWALLALAALLYLWDLGSSGWANAYYSAAAQAGSVSWKAWFFGSFDSSSFITVDKPPASLWVMGLSVRLFGLSSWSILVPQALMGVASVAALYATVKRWFGPMAGLLAGAALAVTPVAALMFRFNNPDALLVMLLVLAAYAVTRAIENGRTRWLLLAGALVGTGFLTKMLQAYLVLPAFALAFLVAAPGSWWKRTWQLLAALGATIVASGWWVAVVELWPSDSRPYIGGSQTNSVVELLFGYNGLGRLTGNEAGSVVPGGTPGAGAWGETGITRLFTSSYGGQIAWLIPAALLLLAAMLVISARAARTDRIRAAAIIWGGWLLITAAVISFSKGIIHEYYTVALAPAIGAIVGIGAWLLWERRASLAARITMSVTVLATTAMAWLLLDRSADFVPWLRYVVLVGGVAAAALLLWLPAFGTSTSGRRWTTAIGLATAGLMLAAPTSYTVQTATTAHTGSLPSAGPAVAGGFGPGRGGAGGPGGQGGPGGFGGGFGGGPGAQGQNGQAFPGGGTAPTFPGGGAAGGFPGGGTAGGTAGGTGGGAAGGGAAGGLLDASTPGAEITALLQQDASSYTWTAAAIGSQTAAGYQLASGEPVMPIGGFNGSDPTPTLSEFESLVSQGKVHYFIAGGMGGGPGGGSASTSSEISTWVQQSFTSSTVDGVTVYDLTSPVTASASTTTTGGTLGA